MKLSLYIDISVFIFVVFIFTYELLEKQNEHDFKMLERKSILCEEMK